MTNPVFQRMYNCNLEEVMKSLQFKCRLVATYDLEMDSNGDDAVDNAQLAEWNPIGPNEYLLAAKFWHIEGDGATAFFVKPTTEEAQAFWDFTMQYKHAS